MTEPVLEKIAQRLREAPDEVLPTLRVLADPDALPTTGDTTVVDLARRVNAHRVEERLSAFRAGALDTSDVRALLGGVSRQAVSSRVASGSLLMLEIGGRSWFPAWQFGAAGVLPGLARLLPVVTRGRRSVLAADALVRTPLPEEDGLSVGDLLADGRVDDAVHYASTAW